MYANVLYGIIIFYDIVIAVRVGVCVHMYV